MKPMQIVTTATLVFSFLGSSASPIWAARTSTPSVDVLAEPSVVHVAQLLRRRRRQANTRANSPSKIEKKAESQTPTVRKPNGTPSKNAATNGVQPTIATRTQGTNSALSNTSSQWHPNASSAETAGSARPTSRQVTRHSAPSLTHFTSSFRLTQIQKKTPTENSVGVMKSTLSKTPGPRSSVTHPVSLSTGLHSVLVKLNGRSR